MLSFTTDAAQNVQSLRLRDDPPPITQPTRPSKKRKTPPTTSDKAQQPQQPAPPSLQQPNQSQSIQVLPPPHALMHPMPGPMPPAYHYAPSDYTPGGMPQTPHPGVPIQQPQQGQQPPQAQQSSRALSNSKRAEQNRKAQRAFRERRDQHVKALESRSELLDAALASADEANRRWEECRALVDQLRVENAALRAALAQAHLLPPNLGTSAATAMAASTNTTSATSLKQEEHKTAESAMDPSESANSSH